MEQVDLFIEGHRPNERVGARVGVGVPARARVARVHGDHDCGECGEAACGAQEAREPRRRSASALGRRAP